MDSRRVVALLRGINVGGHHKVPMADLRALAEGAGLLRPRTVLASGNLAGDSAEGLAAIRGTLEGALARTFDYDAVVLVLEREAVAGIAREYPHPEVAGVHDYVLFFDDAAVRDEAAREAAALGAGQVVTGGGGAPSLPCLFWRAEKGHSIGDALGRLFAAPRYSAHSTNRNLRTVRKISEL